MSALSIYGILLAGGVTIGVCICFAIVVADIVGEWRARRRRKGKGQ